MFVKLGFWSVFAFFVFVFVFFCVFATRGFLEQAAGVLLQLSPIESNHYVNSLSDLFGFEAVWIGLYLYFLYLYLYLYLHVCLQRVYFLKKQQVCCFSSPQLRAITATDYT